MVCVGYLFGIRSAHFMPKNPPHKPQLSLTLNWANMNDSSLKQKLLKLTELRYKYLPELGKRLRSEETVFGAILQAHLFVELLLNEVIALCLEHNAEAIFSARLSFDQRLSIASKLKLANEFPVIEDYALGSLRKLNKLRNKLAHRYNHEVSDEELRELFVGLEADFPYQELFEHGREIVVSMYIAFIYGHIFQKYEEDI